MSGPLIIDSFAGGGGASTGIEMALGRSPDIAVNHDAAALAMHAANHPDTLHLSKNIWQVDPLDHVRAREVGLAWFSPDCKHFSKAKGRKPVKRNVRDLAWTVIVWAKRVRPQVIVLENVEEFRTWGPLVANDNGDWVPCPDRRGETFARWTAELKRLGYRVQFRELVAADYGAPTTRRRLFMIARRDGRPIVWPAPTHAKPDEGGGVPAGLSPWRSAASIIDWTLPCPSIFDTSDEIRAKYGLRAIRPLADATLARVARGVKRYVLDAADPFVVKFQTGSTGSPVVEPLPTVTANSFRKRPGGAPPLGLVAPSIAPITHTGDRRVHDPQEPLRTVTTAHRGEMAVVAPTLVQTGYGEREGQAPRALDLGAPLGTVVAAGPKHALVAAFLAQHNNDGRRIGGVNPGRAADVPLSTITRTPQQAVVAGHLMSMKGTDRQSLDARGPVPTICASTTHAATVAAFLTKYYGSGGQDQAAGEPVHTVTAKARQALVIVRVHGEPYVITDIGMRMLTPRELFSAQGFPVDYVIDGIDVGGRPLTKSQQISCVGNSVCPPVAAAIIAANCGHLVVSGRAVA